MEISKGVKEMKYVDTWDLDAIIPGGTKSPELQEKLQKIDQQINEWEQLIKQWNFSENQSAEPFKRILEKQETIEKGLSQSATFVQMWHDAFMNDEYANVVMGQILDLVSKLENINTAFTKKLVAISDQDWNTFLQDDELKKVAFALNEIRDKGKRLLSEAEEKIITELNKDGLTAWSRLYDTVVSMMTIPFTDKDGKTVELSVGQAMNRMYADPDPEVRKQLFTNWEAAWEKFAPIFTDTINHLDGFRITLQNFHNRKDYLEEPLEYNRMTKDTLDAMWTAVANNKYKYSFYEKVGGHFGSRLEHIFTR